MAPPNFDRTHTSRSRSWSRSRSAAARRGRQTCRRSPTRSSAAGSSTRTPSSRAASRSTSRYRDAGADRDTGPNRPNLIGDPTVRRPATSGSTRRRSATGQRVRATGARHVRQSRAQRAPRPRLLAADASLFKNIRDRRRAAARVPHRGREHLQPREPRQPGLRDRRARQRQPERRPHHRRRRSATPIRSATSSSGCGWCFERGRVRSENAHRRRMDALGAEDGPEAREILAVRPQPCPTPSRPVSSRRSRRVWRRLIPFCLPLLCRRLHRPGEHRLRRHGAAARPRPEPDRSTGSGRVCSSSAIASSRFRATSCWSGSAPAAGSRES